LTNSRSGSTSSPLARVGPAKTSRSPRDGSRLALPALSASPHTDSARSGRKKIGRQPSAISAASSTFFEPSAASSTGIRGQRRRPVDHGSRTDRRQQGGSRARLAIDDIDVVEFNEAFASQVLAVSREVGIDIDHLLNPAGGAIALGHPFGMTGVRLMCTLLDNLDACGGRFGLATLCVGGGQGMALLVERLATTESVQGLTA
jgi:Thiolase, C-terminal domain